MWMHFVALIIPLVEVVVAVWLILRFVCLCSDVAEIKRMMKASKDQGS